MQKKQSCHHNNHIPEGTRGCPSCNTSQVCLADKDQPRTSFPSSRCSLHPWMVSTTLEPPSLLSKAEDLNFAECQAAGTLQLVLCSAGEGFWESCPSSGWQHLVSELLSLPQLLSGRGFPGVLLARVGRTRASGSWWPEPHQGLQAGLSSGHL